MNVSVVICTYSNKRYLDTIDTIKSIVNQTYSNIEIVLIVDRNNNLYNEFKRSDYLSSIRNLKIRLSNLPGLSNARNNGVKHATGEIIAFIDDDAIADRDWITNLIWNYSDTNIIGAGGPMKPLWVAGVANWIPEEFYWTMGCSFESQKKVKHYVRSNFGSNMSFRNTVFKDRYFDDRFGLIDNTMRTGEETEFSIRALNNIPNSKIIFDPNAIVFHKIFKFRKSFRYLLNRCYSYGYAIASIGTSKKDIDEKFESTENIFLKYLINVSYPNKIRNIIILNNVFLNIIKILILSIFTIFVFIGYIFSNIVQMLHVKK